MGKFKKKMDKKVKKMDYHDIKLVKLSTAAFMLFLVTVWPALHDLVMRVHWGWFLAAAIIFSWRPIKRVWM